MTKIKPFKKIFCLIFIAISLNAIPKCLSELIYVQKCYDPQCSEPISRAKTTIKYASNHPNVLSFGNGDSVMVYSKGKNKIYWGVQINGKRGLAPASFLRETNTLQSNLSHEVPLQLQRPILPEKSSGKNKHGAKSQDEADTKADIPTLTLAKETETIPEVPVTPSATVIDGTTILAGYYATQNIDATAIPTDLPPHGIEPHTVANVISQSPSVPQADSQGLRNEDAEKLDPVVDFLKPEPVAVPIEIQNANGADALKINQALEEQLGDKTNLNNSSGKPEEIGISALNNASIAETQEKIVPIENSNQGLPEAVPTINTEVLLEQNEKKNIEILNSTAGNQVVNSLENDATKESGTPAPGAEVIQSNSELPKQNSNVKTAEASSTASTGTQQQTVEVAASATTEATTAEASSTASTGTQQQTVEVTASTTTEATTSSPAKATEATINSTDSTGQQEKPVEVTAGTTTEASSTASTGTQQQTVEVTASTTTEATTSSPTKATEATINSTDSTGQQEKPVEVTASTTTKATTSSPTKATEATINSTDSTGKQEKPVEVTASTTTEAIISNLPSEVPSQTVSKDDKADEAANITYSAELKNASPNNVDTGDSLESGNSTISDSINTEGLTPTTGIPEEKGPPLLDEKNVNQLGVSAETPTVVQNNLLIDPKVVTDINVNNETIVVDDSKLLMQPNDTFETTNDQEASQKSVEMLQSSQEAQVDRPVEQPSNIHMLLGNRNLLHVEEIVHSQDTPLTIDTIETSNVEAQKDSVTPEYTSTESTTQEPSSSEDTFDYYGTTDSDNSVHNETDSTEHVEVTEKPLNPSADEAKVSETISGTCFTGEDCPKSSEYDHLQESRNEEDGIISSVKQIAQRDYWETMLYVGTTAFTILLFSLGYYYIENMRRDGQLIAKINKLEKELLVSTKECVALDETLKVTKNKLTSIEDESFGSNEMVSSLKADLEALQKVKVDLEEQNATLEKDLEGAVEAGLEFERMLREVLSSNNEVNPLAQSVEDLQTRLNAQQAANESLTNALALKTQENESLSNEIADLKKKLEENEVETIRLAEELRVQTNQKNNLEGTLNSKIQSLEMEIKELTADKSALRNELKTKEMEAKDLVEVINQLKSNNLDLDKLYDVSHTKVEATQLREERDELKIRLNEVEGAHHLLEEHMKVIKEEVTTLSDQCKAAEKEKKDAETRLEVLSNFFKEKEAQRQKEEAAWLQKQGEVMSTVERIHTLQNELQSYKQQIEILKREIVDQEREYKSQISALETKVHEQWVVARQTERRLEESKAESSQLRNRLTLIEKNINDADPETKLHRLETNGDTATSSGLYLGAESSSSPIMFSGSSSVPPPPPHSYMFGPPPLPPYLPPPLPSGSGLSPYEISQRPPPLGGRLSSPPPMPPPLHPSHPSASLSRYENAGSPPPPHSPQLYPPYDRHRSPPPHGAFAGDHRIHPNFPPPPLPPSGPLLPPPPATVSSWADESLPPLRNFGPHPSQREQRLRNHKGSLHSSGESLDKSHSGKV